MGKFDYTNSKPHSIADTNLHENLKDITRIVAVNTSEILLIVLEDGTDDGFSDPTEKLALEAKYVNLVIPANVEIFVRPTSIQLVDGWIQCYKDKRIAN